MERRHWELRKLREAIEKEMAWKPVRALALGKVKDYILGKEKPSRDVLDKLALFVGFQDWNSFKEALQGDADAETNYELGEEEPKKGSSAEGKGKSNT